MTYSICESCGKEKDMYYSEWCPRCDKVEPLPATTMNWIQAMDVVVAKHYAGEQNQISSDKDEFWAYFADMYSINNDMYVAINFASVLEDHEKYNTLGDRPRVLKFLELFVNEFDLTKSGNILWHVSW